MSANAEWLGFPEAAVMYSVSTSLLRREANAGKLRTRRLYGRVLTRPEWLDEWFESVATPKGDKPAEAEVAAA